MDTLEQLSTALADRIALAAPLTVGIHTGKRPASGIIWHPDIVVASEQTLPPDTASFQILLGNRSIEATIAGRDPGTNIALLKLATTLDVTLPQQATPIRVGNLALVIGADATGSPTGRLAMVHALGEPWHSRAGGRIDALIRLDTRLGADEGGPVLSLTGGLIGMSTSGPRHRTLVIPTATLARIIPPLLAEGRIARPWLGIGLQPVQIPDTLHQSTGRETGLMVVALVAGGPAETAGILPGDIVLDLDNTPLTRSSGLAALLGPDRIGQHATLRILRAGTIQSIAVTIAPRPAS